MGSLTGHSPGQDLVDDAALENDDLHGTRRSLIHGPKVLKHSLVMKLAAIAPSHYTDSIQASEENYASIMKILVSFKHDFPCVELSLGFLCLSHSTRLHHQRKPIPI